MKRVRTAVVIGAISALLVGCGGGDGPLSRSEWVTAADTSCQQVSEENAIANTELDALLKAGLTTPAERQKASELVTAGIGNLEFQYLVISGLHPPPENETDEAKFAHQLQTKIELARLYAAALATGGAAELEAALIQMKQNEAAIEGLAEDLEMKVCGRPAGLPGKS